MECFYDAKFLFLILILPFWACSTTKETEPEIITNRVMIQDDDFLPCKEVHLTTDNPIKLDSAISSYIIAKTGYPDYLRLKRIQGNLIIQAIVNTEGKVVSSKVLRSLHFVHDKAVQSVVMDMIFKPATHQGKPVCSTLTIPMYFRIPS